MFGINDFALRGLFGGFGIIDAADTGIVDINSGTVVQLNGVARNQFG